MRRDEWIVVALWALACAAVFARGPWIGQVPGSPGLQSAAWIWELGTPGVEYHAELPVTVIRLGIVTGLAGALLAAMRAKLADD